MVIMLLVVMVWCYGSNGDGVAVGGDCVVVMKLLVVMVLLLVVFL